LRVVEGDVNSDGVSEFVLAATSVAPLPATDCIL
jgi:hypothetical protein